MSFEFDGEKYKAASSHQKEWGAKLIAEFDFKGTEKILDLGCGDGAITDQLAQLVPNGDVTGIDASQNMIDTARKNYKRENLDFVLLDINEINYLNEFDIIISNATLHWILDHKKLLSNIYEALNKNGVARFNFAADGNCATFFKVVKRSMQNDEFVEYFKEFQWPWYLPKIDKYEPLVNLFLFKDKKVWGENADRFFPDVDAMVKWVDQPSLVPFLKHMNNDEIGKKFRQLVVNEMIKETKQGDGTCFETFRRINIFLRK